MEERKRERERMMQSKDKKCFCLKLRSGLPRSSIEDIKSENKELRAPLAELRDINNAMKDDVVDLK